MMWTAADLATATGGRASVPFGATGVSIDTRTLQPGDLFVALVGENGDGHAHVAAALGKGAAGALVHRPMPGATLLVPDTLEALWALGRFARARFCGRVAAVTGSVGKTTVKEMLRTILSAAGPTHAAAASYNNHWGVPLTLARLPAEAQFCVAEIGTNHPGEIAPLARLVRPHVAAITTIAAAHIGHFGSLDAIAAEKAAIFAGLEPDGVAVLPAAWADLHPGARLFAGPDSATPDTDGTSFTASIGGRVVSTRVNAAGPHMVANALAALTVADALGVDGASALPGFAPMAGRGARRSLPGGGILLDESYNASGASIRAALAVLRALPGRRVAVLGDMLELGDHGPAEHTGLAPAITESTDLLFTCGPLMRGLFDSVPAGLRGAHAADAAALAPVVAARMAAGDAVLVKGSLGSRMAQIVRVIEGAV